MTLPQVFNIEQTRRPDGNYPTGRTVPLHYLDGFCCGDTKR
jgi:hypothetical protein